jgi:hypothetical protein
MSRCSTSLEVPLELIKDLERLGDSLLSSSDAKYTWRWPEGTCYGFVQKYKFSSGELVSKKKVQFRRAGKRTFKGITFIAAW